MRRPRFLLGACRRAPRPAEVADFLDDAQAQPTVPTGNSLHTLHPHPSPVFEVAELMKRHGDIAKDPNRTPTPRAYRPLSAGRNMAGLSFEQVEERLKRKIVQAYGDFKATFKAADGDASGCLPTVSAAHGPVPLESTWD